MPNQTEVTVCPNPKCHREIEEPILLKVLSTSPAEQYNACPHCFFKLDMDAENKEDAEQEPAPPSSSPLEKVIDAISTLPQKELGEEEEKTEKEELPAKPSEDADAISTLPQKELGEEEEKTEKEELPAKPSERAESSSGCTHKFGYLASRPKNEPIPQECLTCQKIVDCMLKLGAT